MPMILTSAHGRLVFRFGRASAMRSTSELCGAHSAPSCVFDREFCACR
jgi:hypothetical protein